jgi:hypothetical protein
MKDILICAGLGDFIASESYMTDEECLAVETVYWATANQKFIEEAVQFDKIFPNLKEHKVLYNDWGTPEDQIYKRKWFRIFYKIELNSLLNLSLDKQWLENELLDSGPPNFYNEIYKGTRSYVKSRIAQLEYPLPNIALPEKFVLIHPWSETLRDKNRDFDADDWAGVFGFLEKHNIQGIVVNKSTELPPSHHMLTDLSNQLTLPEVFGLAQRATYYMGCASFLHVLTPKLLDEDRIFIKSKYAWLKPEKVQFKFYHGLVSKDFRCYNSLNFLKDL